MSAPIGNAESVKAILAEHKGTELTCAIAPNRLNEPQEVFFACAQGVARRRGCLAIGVRVIAADEAVRTAAQLTQQPDVVARVNFKAVWLFGQIGAGMQGDGLGGTIRKGSLDQPAAFARKALLGFAGDLLPQGIGQNQSVDHGFAAGARIRAARCPSLRSKMSTSSPRPVSSVRTRRFCATLTVLMTAWPGKTKVCVA